MEKRVIDLQIIDKRVLEFHSDLWLTAPMRTRCFSNIIPVLFCIIFLFTSGSIPSAGADPLKEVVSVSPSWENFTNKDGTGLYHEILARIFSPLGIRVTHKYTNAKRGMYLLKHDLADLYTCRTDVNDFPEFMIARHQMYEGQFYAVFKKSRFTDWQGISSLSGHKVLWRRGYYKISDFNVNIIAMETDSGVSALGQVSLDRGDFYIDDLNLIEESFSRSIFPINRAAYRIEPVGKRTYHPVFKKSKRGKAIMAVFDAGMEKLCHTGELKKIFQKWVPTARSMGTPVCTPQDR